MAKSIPPPAFAWIAEGWLAVGDVPSSADELSWLLQHGLRVFIAHGEIPQDMCVSMGRSSIGHYFYSRTEEPDDRPPREVMEYIAHFFVLQKPVYVCSGSGIEVASGIAKAFLAKSDLHVTNNLSRRARDLSRGGSWGQHRDYGLFGGDTIFAAISLLIAAMSRTDPETRVAAAGALVNLMAHVGHWCYPEEAVQMLIALRSEVEVIILAAKPEQRDYYEAVFRRFDKDLASPRLFSG